jgi:hypothetical protein
MEIMQNINFKYIRELSNTIFQIIKKLWLEWLIQVFRKNYDWQSPKDIFPDKKESFSLVLLLLSVFFLFRSTSFAFTIF